MPTTPIEPNQGDPLNQIIDAAAQDELLFALIHPTDPAVPAVTVAQIRAALRSLGERVPAESEYHRFSLIKACPICHTAQEIEVESGPHPTYGRMVVVGRWARHPRPQFGSVCRAATTWVEATA